MIFDNQQTIYDSIRSNLVADAEDADFLVIYKASGNLQIVVTCPNQRARMIKLGLVHASVSANKENTFLTDKGMRVYKRLEHAFRGTTYDPLWGRGAQGKSPIMTPKNDTYRKGIDDSIEWKTFNEYSLQTLVKGLRTAWSQRPRITRFTLRSWVYRWNIWLNGTAPDTSMIDWSAFSIPEWSEEDRKNQKQVWHDSDLLAFWLCPDGIEAGIEAHDKFLRICEKRGIKSASARKEVISEITGIAVSKPNKIQTSENAIDEILNKSAYSRKSNPKFAINVSENETEYFYSYDDAIKFKMNRDLYRFCIRRSDS